MKKIKKLCLTLILFAAYPSNIFAAGVNYRIPNPTNFQSIEDIVNASGSLIRPVFILTFGGMVIYGAWMRLTSKGDAGKIESSVKIITAAATGFAIAVLAPTLVNFVLGLLRVDSVVGI